MIEIYWLPFRCHFKYSLFAGRSLSADYFGYQPYYDQFYMEPIDVPGKYILFWAINRLDRNKNLLE